MPAAAVFRDVERRHFGESVAVGYGERVRLPVQDMETVLGELFDIDDEASDVNDSEGASGNGE